MESNCKLTIILPVYNPHNGWENEFINSLNKLDKEFDDLNYCIVIVNDGSTNDIGNFMENNILPFYKNLKYYSYPKNEGKGFAIRHGLENSYSDYYIYTDFDFPFGVCSVRQIYDRLIERKTNLVIGTRNHAYLKTLPFKRRLVSFGLMIFNVFITRFRVSDTQAGLKGLDNNARNIFLTTKINSFVFEFEFILKCLKKNIKYSFVHVVPNFDIKFSNFSRNTLNHELYNYIKIIFGRS